MDVEWALAQLENWFHLRERVPLPPEEATPSRKTRPLGSDSERDASDHVVRSISDAVYTEPLRYIRPESSELHPWVWDAARPHWTSGNHDAAVWAAGVNVNSRLQTKIGRKDLSDGRLIRDAFGTDDPKPGHPRLRLADDSNPDHFKDVHAGAANFGQGLYAAVRNVVNHVDAGEHSFREGEALEALAAFSLLARWIDRAQVVSVEATAI
jgi:hypothetical protein